MNLVITLTLNETNTQSTTKNKQTIAQNTLPFSL